MKQQCHLMKQVKSQVDRMRIDEPNPKMQSPSYYESIIGIGTSGVRCQKGYSGETE
jgi:hypothetical protein